MFIIVYIRSTDHGLQYECCNGNGFQSGDESNSGSVICITLVVIIYCRGNCGSNCAITLIFRHRSSTRCKWTGGVLEVVHVVAVVLTVTVTVAVVVEVLVVVATLNILLVLNSQCLSCDLLSSFTQTVFA